MLTVFFSGCTNVATFPDDWIDKETNSLKIIDETHSQIHEGNHYKFEQYFLLNNSETLDLLVVTNNKELHLNYYYSFEYGEGELLVYYNPTYTGGSLEPVYNSNLELINVTSDFGLISNTIITDVGTLLFSSRLGDRRESFTISREDNEIILPPNSILLLRFINQNTGSNLLNIRIVGYEHID